MSRVIKFRAWDTESKEMSYDYLSKNWLKVCIESPYVELMQYTGLTDRAGKPIYEGDILRTFKGDFVVAWRDYKFVLPDFYFASNDGPDDYFSERADDEVIGNVYENPYLLHG